MDEWDAMGHGMKIDRRSTDCGLLSLIIGGCFLIMSPIMLTFNIIYWTQGVQMHTRFELDIALVATVVIGAAFDVLILIGMISGFRSMSLASSSSHPKALGFGGVILCSLDMALWLGLWAHLLNILGVFT